MEYIKGKILTNHGFINGYLNISSNKETQISKGLPPEKPVAEGLIVPTFINSHTHIGDSFIQDKNIKLTKSVIDLVAPPNGLKHKLLNEASEEEIVSGMKKSIEGMIKTGTSCFCDFRENGIRGISLIQKALKSKNINSIVLSRPKELKYNKNELDLLLKKSNGIGLSSISDWDYSELGKISKHTKRKSKLFSLHASEAFREDIDLVLDLKPNFLIHMTNATESDLERVKDENIPIVICPRSSEFFNIKIDLELMKKTKIEIMLGSDNCMLNFPDILQDLKFIKGRSNVFSVEELLKMITYSPRKVLNLEDCINGPNLSGNYVVLDRSSLDPIYISK